MAFDYSSNSSSSLLFKTLQQRRLTRQCRKALTHTHSPPSDGGSQLCVEQEHIVFGLISDAVTPANAHSALVSFPLVHNAIAARSVADCIAVNRAD
jgi:hypothetical protein